jgi:isoquinoline 1-oxidoreductase beta subunit
MQHGYYRPASLVRIRAGLDAQGKVAAMHTTIACPSIQSVFASSPQRRNAIDGAAVRAFSDMPYAVANQRVDYAMRNGHVPVGYWRAPGQQNAYYRECFIDELAAAAGKDPVEFRLAMLDPADKNRRVLEAVAKAANWSSPLPAGRYRGVAVADGFGSYTALVAELSLNPAGEVKVQRVVIAIDSGYVVNPDTCHAQAESNVVYGLGSILYQENNVKDGRIVESNFHDFRLPRIGEIPKVETVLVPSGGFWGGHGEPAILGLAPAVCNALFAVTGKRIRSLPLKHHDLRPI